MSPRSVVTVLALISLALVVGCGGSAPTTTPAPTHLATVTRIAFTETPAPRSSPTVQRPTRVTNTPTSMPTDTKATNTPTSVPTDTKATNTPASLPTDAPEPTITPLLPTTTPHRGDEELRITILYDNTAYDPRLKAEWGFAALIEYGEETLLFDTGGDAPTLLGNMELLGIDPTRIETVVLSHIHGDHTGGLGALDQAGARPTVYVLPSFPDDFKGQLGVEAQVVEVEPGQQVAEAMYTTGEIAGVPVPEQALVIKTEDGLVIVTGCAHPGIVQMVSRAKEQFGGPIG